METGFPLLWFHNSRLLSAWFYLFMVLLRLAYVNTFIQSSVKSCKAPGPYLAPRPTIELKTHECSGMKDFICMTQKLWLQPIFGFSLQVSWGPCGCDTWVTFWPQMRKRNSGFNHSCKALLVYQLNFIYRRCCLSGKNQKKRDLKSTPFSSSPVIFMYLLGSGCFGYSRV